MEHTKKIQQVVTWYPTDHSLDVLIKQILKVYTSEASNVWGKERKYDNIVLLTKDSIHNHIRLRLRARGIRVSNTRTLHSMCIAIPTVVSNPGFGEWNQPHPLALKELISMAGTSPLFLFCPIEWVCDGMFYDFPRQVKFFYTGSTEALMCKRTCNNVIQESFGVPPKRLCWIGFNLPEHVADVAVDYKWLDAEVNDYFMSERYETLDVSRFHEFKM